MAHYLGIDLGTSAIEAVVVDDAQVVRAQATQPIETTRLNDGRVVQDPDSWWSAVGHIGDWLKHGHAAAMADVRGIGLSEQMQDAVRSGAQGPCYDRRSFGAMPDQIVNAPNWSEIFRSLSAFRVCCRCRDLRLPN